MLRPTLDEVQEMREARGTLGNIVPIYREVPADLETPVSAFLKVERGAVLVPARIGRGRRAAGALQLHRHGALPRVAHGRRPRRTAGRPADRRSRTSCGASRRSRSPGLPRFTRRRRRLPCLRSGALLREAARCRKPTRRASRSRSSCSRTRCSSSTTCSTHQGRQPRPARRRHRSGVPPGGLEDRRAGRAPRAAAGAAALRGEAAAIRR